MTHRRIPQAWRRGLVVWLLILSAATAAGATDDPGQLADEALRANPGLEALRARVDELRELASAAGTWKDPVLGITYANAPVDSFSLNDSPMSALEFRAQQTIPPWSWSRLREEEADSRTRSSEHALREAETQLRRQVHVIFWRLTLSRMLEEVTRDHIARTEELLRAVRARYETGSAGQHQMLRLEVLHDRLQDDLGDFGRADRELSAALSQTLSRPESRFATPERLEPVPVVGNVSDWLALARDQRPELQRLAETIRTHEVGADLARVDRIPDVTVWVGYRIREIDTALDDGTDQVSAGISVPLPWGSGQRSRAERAARLQAARAARARLTAELDRIESKLTATHARWTRMFQQAVTYRDGLTPDARAALDASFTDYTVGRADFSTLFEAEVDLLNLERTLRSATVETRIQRAVAQATIGAEPQGGQP